MSEVIITVRGEHELRVAPERATIHLSVSFEGPGRTDVVERTLAAGELSFYILRGTGRAVTSNLVPDLRFLWSPHPSRRGLRPLLRVSACFRPHPEEHACAQRKRASRRMR